MKKLVALVVLLLPLASCGSQVGENTPTEQTQNATVVETKKLTPEQAEAIEEYLKTVEQTLRDDGGFDEATIQQALELKRAEEEKKFLEQ